MSAGPTNGSTPAVARGGYAFGPYRVDVAARRVSRGPDTIALPSRAFDTLVYLIEHRERLVDKEELLRAVWQDVIVTDDSLIHAVSVLRRTLVHPEHRPLIETVPRRGYRFVLPVDAGDETRQPPDTPLDGPRSAAATPVAVPQSRHVQPWSPWLWPAGATLVLIGIAMFLPARAPTTAPDAVDTIRLYQPPPPGTAIVSGGMLSPDGQHLVFVARDLTSGKSALWLRRLQSSDLRRLRDTEGASKPFWSPDSRRIGFFAADGIAIVDLDGERTQSVVRVDVAPAGGTWGPDDTIVFADWTNGLYAVHASGAGGVRQLRRLDRSAQEIAHTWPQFLPDGRHYLYHAMSLDRARTGVYVASADDSAAELLLATESPAAFAAPNFVIHVQNGMLVAEEVDLSRLELTGRSILLARDIALPSLGDGDIVSASANLVAFREGTKQQNLAWLDRAGVPVGSLQVPTTLFNPRVSPDETYLLATSSVTNDPGLWLAKLSREEYSRLETDAIAPLWAPDGTRVAFTSRDGVDLLVRPVSADGVATPLLRTGTLKILSDWSPDGSEIVYTQGDGETKLDLWSVSVDSGRAAPLLATPYNEMQARFSPDGRWLAYASDESGALEVYVASYPGLERRFRASLAGGGQPQWRSDQRELFFLSADRELVAVEVSESESRLLGPPRVLFRPSLGGGPGDARDHYAVTAGGTRFLFDSADSAANRGPITVMVNWPGATAHRRLYLEPAERVSLATP
jgi:DNA-binding winged helix-turn-helix (wHTH) protein/Tol biopolymer transport system component